MPPGGALIDIAVLFADIRGSTSLGAKMHPAEYAALMNRFYKAATNVLASHDAIIDKLIGDEVMALFIPGLAGPDYRRKACEAGLELIRAVNRDSATREGLAFGVGVHSGPAFVGNVGGGGVVDFTALGDTVNTAARLQAVARPGELVISEALCRLASAPDLDGERRTVELKGKSEPFAVRIVLP